MNWATLTNRDNGKQTRVAIRGGVGLWTCTERARRAAFLRIGADPQSGANDPIITDHTVRFLDPHGDVCYVLWVAANRQMKPFIFGDWHVWIGTDNRIMCSDERTKTLKDFTDIDACVNYLFVYANKSAARDLWAHWKAR